MTSNQGEAPRDKAILTTEDAVKLISTFELQQSRYSPPRNKVKSIAGDALSQVDQPVVVDVGAGTGSFANQLILAHPELTVACIDIDPVLIKLAQMAHPGMSYIDADILQSGWTSEVKQRVGYVNIVTALAVVHYLSDDSIKRFLTDSQSILKTDGIIIISDRFENRNACPEPFGQQSRRRPTWQSWWASALEAPGLEHEFQARRLRMEMRTEPPRRSALESDTLLSLIRQANFNFKIAYSDGQDQVIIARRRT